MRRIATLTIPEAPPSPNVMRRWFRTPHRYRRLRDEWQLSLLAAASLEERNVLRAAASARTRIHVDIVIEHRQTFDTDNLYGAVKTVLDALRNIGFVFDDSPASLALKVEQVRAHAPRTVLHLWL